MNSYSFNYLKYNLPKMALRCPSNVWRIVCLISFTDLPRNCSEAVWSSSSAFIILHCATPVTDRGTPWDVSTLSHCGLSVITSRDRRCTSVTNHHAHDHPPTMVTRFVEPQQPPVEKNYKQNKFQYVDKCYATTTFQSDNSWTKVPYSYFTYKKIFIMKLE